MYIQYLQRCTKSSWIDTNLFMDDRWIIAVLAVLRLVSLIIMWSSLSWYNLITKAPSFDLIQSHHQSTIIWFHILIKFSFRATNKSSCMMGSEGFSWCSTEHLWWRSTRWWWTVVVSENKWFNGQLKADVRFRDDHWFDWDLCSLCTAGSEKKCKKSVQRNTETNMNTIARFLSDPGIPGVRSMGPSLCNWLSDV